MHPFSVVHAFLVHASVVHASVVHTPKKLTLPSLILGTATPHWLTARLGHKGRCSTDHSPTQETSLGSSYWTTEKKHDGRDDNRYSEGRLKSFQDHCRSSLKKCREINKVLMMMQDQSMVNVILSSLQRRFVNLISYTGNFLFLLMMQSFLLFTFFLTVSWKIRCDVKRMVRDEWSETKEAKGKSHASPDVVCRRGSDFQDYFVKKKRQIETNDVLFLSRSIALDWYTCTFYETKCGWRRES